MSAASQTLHLILTCHYQSDEPPTPSPEDNNAGPCVTFGSLPDPQNRYRAFKKNLAHCGYEMSFPPVFNADGDLVIPSKYEGVIPDSTVVVVRGTMRM